MGELIATLTISGLSMGIIYSLIAMGLILLIRAVGVLNFAQGDFLTLGAYIGLTMFVNLDLPLWGAALASLLIFIAFGVLFMLCVYSPLKDSQSPIMIIIATMGASIVIRETLMLIFGGDPIKMRYFLLNEAGKGMKVKLFGVSFQAQYIFIIIVGGLIIFAVYYLLDKLYAGKMLQAASQDKFSAELIGIPVTVTIAVTYALSVSVAGFAGFMVAPLYSVSTSLSAMQINAFAGVVIGGWGDIKGAIAGALLVGLIQSFASIWFSTYKNTAVFIVMILFLLLRPQGLFGSKVGDKA